MLSNFYSEHTLQYQKANLKHVATTKPLLSVNYQIWQRISWNVQVVFGVKPYVCRTLGCVKQRGGFNKIKVFMNVERKEKNAMSLRMCTDTRILNRVCRPKSPIGARNRNPGVGIRANPCIAELAYPQESGPVQNFARFRICHQACPGYRPNNSNQVRACTSDKKHPNITVSYPTQKLDSDPEYPSMGKDRWPKSVVSKPSLVRWTHMETILNIRHTNYSSQTDVFGMYRPWNSSIMIAHTSVHLSTHTMNASAGSDATVVRSEKKKRFTRYIFLLSFFY